MASRSFALLASLLAVASASPCKPVDPPVFVLPSTGTGTQLPSPDPSLRLLKIAVGHGLQNYTCASSTASTVATGALAVLYDITNLYPGTPSTGVDADAFYGLPGSVLWGQDIPLNLQTPSAASPGTATSPNKLAENLYGAIVPDPFPSPVANLDLGGLLAGGAPFLGHHYFDANGVPTFDLSSVNLFASLSKTGDIKAPATADPGILGSGAVDWLQLTASSNGLSRGIELVYRVTTAGGASEACSAIDGGEGSVPYTALYWFYG
ncbi:malate dehydrogenase [Niveomyces insectorum RCEF 264]|uniref:Malate dehydrogenase n=1 Tax=Niveomyces insectorum RCEF 264 TaxID=1081102 RepID=A0A167Y6F8_9HYPO|nr:malate dehydrogenase [Niveomyces insectorum RCEF 264]